jgi:hypothetical protein
LATLIDVPLNTFRMSDSGLRPAPPRLLQHATVAITEHAREHRNSCAPRSMTQASTFVRLRSTNEEATALRHGGFGRRAGAQN